MLRGKFALVTGASSGIGRATCLAFAREGVSGLICTDLHVGDTVNQLKSINDKLETSFVACDVGNSSSVESLLEHVESRFGRLDIAFNCAGVLGKNLTPLHKSSVTDFDNVMNTNARGVFLCMKHELAIMRKQAEGGVIVNAASVAGLNSMFGNSTYCASKHAVIGLTKTAAAENATKNIRVNAVCPGVTETPMAELKDLDANQSEQYRKAIIKGIPLGRFGTPEEIAAAVLFLSSDGAAWMTGQTIVMDGGLLNARL